METEIKCSVENCEGTLMDIGKVKGQEMFMCDWCGKKFKKEEVDPPK